jgi:hypothetical protein
VSEGKPSLIQLSANASYNHVMLSVRTIGVGNRLQGATDEKVYEIDKNKRKSETNEYLLHDCQRQDRKLYWEK